jgi:fructose 1,6-bisphosphate aldolase/phosphatase
MKITLSVIKADVGSIGGHTKPSAAMLEIVRGRVGSAIEGGLLIDGIAVHTGDDIAIVMSHRHGVGAALVHRFAWSTFVIAAEEASDDGLCATGQDLLADAPSGSVRGAGPAVAEIEFYRDPASKDRPAEAFLVFAADKCGPGAYSYPLYTAFCDPMHNDGLLLDPKMRRGFAITVMDMEYAGRGDRLIRLDVPERIWDLACLLQNPDRFAIEAINSRHRPEEQIASVSTTRLHSIAGHYTGKDDPVAIIRTQGIFPAPEKVVEPYTLGHFVTGDCRGSHVMPMMPVAINTAAAGPYGLPLVSCLAFSMDGEGRFAREHVDVFANVAWEQTRLKVQAKADEWRRQGFIGPTMASPAELSRTGLLQTLASLERDFELRHDNGAGAPDLDPVGHAPGRRAVDF